ncbi:MAG: lectin-like domain-containing protein [Flavobacteriales bacterium]
MVQRFKNSKAVCLFLNLFISFSALQAQYALVGNAAKITPSYYRLTQDVMWQNGSMWNTTKIDLSNSFDLLFELYFGDDNNGADGISFTLQQQGTNAGSSGGGLGVFGVTPSLIVEYDTYENVPYADPSFDHIAIVKNGVIDHGAANNLAGPVKANTAGSDIENGQWHNSRVIWDAKTHKLEVYFDCQLRLTYTGDIVSSIFSGNALVYYGFTAATGGATNEQSVRGFHFTQTKNFESTICAGDSTQVDLSGDLTYNWQPATGVSQVNSPNPYLFPTVATQYIVTITNNCFETWKDTVMVNVNPLPVIDLGSDKSVCQGSPATVFNAGNPGSTYLWSTGETTQNISVTLSGTYTVKVTNTLNCSAEDNVILTAIPKPTVDLGPDIEICTGQTATISSNLNDPKFLWSTGESTASIKVNNNASIWLKAYYDSSCPTYDTMEVKTVTAPLSALFKDSTVCFREIRSLTLDAGTGAKNYLWNTGESSSAINVTDGGSYTLTLSNGSCQIKDTVDISEFCLMTLFAPNAFTPLTRDGQNDIFYMKGISVDEFHLMIFNRWGEMIHESFDISEGWDGYYQGHPVQVDVYVWKVEWKEDTKMEQIGTVAVIN